LSQIHVLYCEPGLLGYAAIVTVLASTVALRGRLASAEILGEVGQMMNFVVFGRRRPTLRVFPRCVAEPRGRVVMGAKCVAVGGGRRPTGDVLVGPSVRPSVRAQ